MFNMYNELLEESELQESLVQLGRDKMFDVVHKIRQSLNDKRVITSDVFRKVKSIKNGEKLSKEEKEKLGNDIKKLLASLGYSIVFMMPGGSIFIITYKLIKKLMNNKLDENQELKGGKGDEMTPKKIADKFGVKTKDVENQIEKGKKVEREHTKDKEKELEIATDHVSEFPDYYDRLEKMEKEAEKHWETMKESKKLIKKLLRENIEGASIKQQIFQQIKDLGLNPNDVDVTMGDKPVFVGQGPTTEIDSEITEGLGSKAGKFLVSCAIGVSGLVSCKKEDRYMYKFVYQDAKTVATNPNLRGSSYFAYPKGDYSQEFLDSEALRIEKDVEKQLNIDIVDGTAELIFVEKDNGQWR